jgi:pimeloyl-ACP methyl ester carboxylesterase
VGVSGFAELLRQKRLECGLTQEELAERAKLSVRAISDLERGVNHSPRLSTLRMLCTGMGSGPSDAAALLAAARGHPVSTRVKPLFDIRYAIRSDGARTAYGTVGSGPVLLIAPGMLSHLEWWDSAPGVMTFLGPLAEHRTIVLYDRHGCGLSDHDRSDFTAEDDLRDIEAVARDVGPSDLDLFGTSWGALPIIGFAARHPKRVRRLVLHGASGPSGAYALTEQIRQRRAALVALRRADLDVYVRALASMFFPSGVDSETLASFVRIHRMAASVDMQERLDSVSFDYEPLLPAINAPTLVLHRRGDLVCPFESGQRLTRAIPGARFLPLDGDAHFAWIGDTESIVTPMLEFLLDPGIDPDPRARPATTAHSGSASDAA